jgi:signal peptidase I
MPSKTQSSLTLLFHVLLPLGHIFMSFSLLCLAVSSHTPVVAVVSGSMEPAFHRGDVLFLWNRSEIAIGDIPVVWFQGNPLPMVHRVVKVVSVPETGAGVDADRQERQFLTKGDNNELDDLGLYPPGRELVRRSEVVGTVVGYVPAVGRPALWMMDSRTWLSQWLGGG